MIATASNITTETTVFTCPANKKAIAEIYLCSNDSAETILKINDIVCVSMPLSTTLSIKLILEAGDTVKVSSPVSGSVNVIISGLLI
jgi:hypothetical protein